MEARQIKRWVIVARGAVGLPSRVEHVVADNLDDAAALARAVVGSGEEVAEIKHAGSVWIREPEGEF
jgi:hypothetical protein